MHMDLISPRTEPSVRAWESLGGTENKINSGAALKRKESGQPSPIQDVDHASEKSHDMGHVKKKIATVIKSSLDCKLFQRGLRFPKLPGFAGLICPFQTQMTAW